RQLDNWKEDLGESKSFAQFGAATNPWHTLTQGRVSWMVGPAPTVRYHTLFWTLLIVVYVPVSPWWDCLLRWIQRYTFACNVWMMLFICCCCTNKYSKGRKQRSRSG
ncbi:unnamed protein product, partial [Ectocarpus sp. 6 AP-2014]